MSKLKIFRTGDTIVEVIFAITVFCMIAVIGMSLMNQGITTAQISLEVSLAREEINAQAEALRFIHNSYVAERELVPGRQESLPENSVYQQYTGLWNTIAASAVGLAPDLSTTSIACPERPGNTFVLNTRDIKPNDTTSFINDSRLVYADVFPRILYGSLEDSNEVDNVAATNLVQAQGVWVLAVQGANFYDFHIRACWSAPGRNVATTIGTIVRLYNPESF